MTLSRHRVSITDANLSKPIQCFDQLINHWQNKRRLAALIPRLVFQSHGSKFALKSLTKPLKIPRLVFQNRGSKFALKTGLNAQDIERKAENKRVILVFVPYSVWP